MEFEFRSVPAGFHIRKSYRKATRRPLHDISGPFWMLIRIAAVGGPLKFLCDGEEIVAPAREAWLYVPTWGWTTEHSEPNTRFEVEGLISQRALANPRFTVPTLFSGKGALPATSAGALLCLERARDPIPVATCARPRASVRRLKELMDRSQTGETLGELASKIGASPAALSRAFKDDYGFSPVVYRRGLRVTIGMYALMKGMPIADAAAIAGYDDLSRFNKQFREYLSQSPKEYKRRK